MHKGLTLTQLYRKLDEAKDHRDDCKLKVDAAQTALNKAEQRIGILISKINQLKGAELHVSEHAIVRYAERILGVDIGQARRYLNRAAAKYKDLENAKIPLQDDNGRTIGTMIMRNRTILTVVGREKT